MSALKGLATLSTTNYGYAMTDESGITYTRLRAPKVEGTEYFDRTEVQRHLSSDCWKEAGML